jgi:hypothetical protein
MEIMSQPDTPYGAPSGLRRCIMALAIKVMQEFGIIAAEKQLHWSSQPSKSGTEEEQLAVFSVRDAIRAHIESGLASQELLRRPILRVRRECSSGRDELSVEVGEQGDDISCAVEDVQHVNPLPNVAVENQVLRYR